MHEKGRASFNPCCPGSASSTYSRALAATSVRRFNPCCPGSASSTFVCPSPGPSRLMFQSLLSWIGLLNLYPCRGPTTSPARFNPCCPGSASSTFPSPRLARANWCSFNPCCPGSASSTAKVQQERAVKEGFNPCCPGSASSTAPFALPVQDAPLFQSLLSWIGLLHLAGDGPQSAPDAVSILVVLDRPPQQAVAVRPQVFRHRFNPCCPGSASSTWLPRTP